MARRPERPTRGNGSGKGRSERWGPSGPRRPGGGWDGEFPPSRPIDVQGGIRAQSQRGRFAESWWAARWIAVLESFQIGGRLGRGRAYARRGQVLSIAIDKGIVRARVQGSRPDPYEVSVTVRTLTADEWTRVARQLASEAAFAAKLLAGEMPRDAEQAFARAGASLFPEQARELTTSCSCPDWSNPCKHVAAVYYLLGEEFDRDPFLLFTLRGQTRDELLASLRDASSPSSRSASASAASAAPESEPESESAAASAPALTGDAAGMLPETSVKPVALALDAARFWGDEQPLPELTADVEPPPVHAEPVRRLGRFPFWRGQVPPLEILEPLYAAASRRALDLLAGNASASDDADPAPDADADR